jgi:predicted secreted protein
MKKATTPSGPYLDTKNSTSPTATKNTIIIDGCQERISVKKGEIVQILLPATAGTGYAWTLATPSTILSQNQTNNIKYKQEPNADPKIVGAPQKQILEFTAISTGSETIDVIYSRSFEKNKAAKKCTIAVNVQ